MDAEGTGDKPELTDDEFCFVHGLEPRDKLLTLPKEELVEIIMGLRSDVHELGEESHGACVDCQRAAEHMEGEP